MNFKTTYILFALLLGLVTAFILAQVLGRRPDEVAAVLPDLVRDKVKPSEIDTVEIDRTQPRQEKLVFVFDKEKKAWKMTEPHHLKINSADVDDLVRQVVTAKREPKGKADLTPNLALQGLEPPNAKVTLRKGDKSWTLLLGNQSPGSPATALVYALAASDPKEVMAIQRNAIDRALRTVNDFRTRDLLADIPFDMTAVKLVGPTGKEVSLEKVEAADWRFVKPNWGEAEYQGPPAAPLPPGQRKIAGVSDLLEAIAAIRVGSDDDFKDNDVNDLAKYGLETDKPTTLRIDAKLGATGDGTLLIGNKADEKGEKFFARLGGSNNIVTVTKNMVDPILVILDNPGILRSRDLTHLLENQVDAIELTNAKTGPKAPLNLRRASSVQPWQTVTGTTTELADDEAVKVLLAALLAKRQIKDFPSPEVKDEELGLDKPVAVVALWKDGVEKDPEGNAKPGLALKAGEPTIKVLFGKDDMEVVYVKRIVGKNSDRLALPASLLAKVSIGKVDLLDKNLVGLAKIPMIDMLQYTVVRGKDVIHAEKDQTKWKLRQPSSLAGRLADTTKVDNAIADMQFLLFAKKYVADAASDSDLERYGLKENPAIKITVAYTDTDKKAKEATYYIGKEDEEKSGYYARQGTSSRVFIVTPDFFKGIPKDLLDLTVANFPMDRVEKVKLTGWQKIETKPVTLELARKGTDDWTVTNDPAFKGLDSKKVERFIADVCRLRALKFEIINGVALATQELAVGQGALEIAITLKGDKDPFVLTVGALKKDDNAYYAKSSNLPNDVFLVADHIFKDVMQQGRAYFRPALPPTN